MIEYHIRYDMPDGTVRHDWLTEKELKSLKEAMEAWKRYQSLVQTVKKPPNYATGVNAAEAIKTEYSYVDANTDSFTKFYSCYRKDGGI